MQKNEKNQEDSISIKRETSTQQSIAPTIKKGIALFIVFLFVISNLFANLLTKRALSDKKITNFGVFVQGGALVGLYGAFVALIDYEIL